MKEKLGILLLSLMMKYTLHIYFVVMIIKLFVWILVAIQGPPGSINFFLFVGFIKWIDVNLLMFS